MHWCSILGWQQCWLAIWQSVHETGIAPVNGGARALVAGEGRNYCRGAGQLLLSAEAEEMAGSLPGGSSGLVNISRLPQSAKYPCRSVHIEGAANRYGSWLYSPVLPECGARRLFAKTEKAGSSALALLPSSQLFLPLARSREPGLWRKNKLERKLSLAPAVLNPDLAEHDDWKGDSALWVWWAVCARMYWVCGRADLWRQVRSMKMSDHSTQGKGKAVWKWES